MLSGSAVTGWGSALPKTEVPNDLVAKRLGVDPGWITARTGIAARRIAAPDETATSLGAAAGRAALAAAGLDTHEIDVVIAATLTPDMRLPATATLIQAELGAGRAGAFDLNAGCAGFLYALAQADGLVRAGTARRVLVCGVDLLSRVTDPADPQTAPLFADGAGAVVVEASERDDLGPFVLHSDGSEPRLLCIPPGEDAIRMDGRAVYRRAVDEMASSLKEVTSGAGVRVEDVELVIGHQANARILQAVAERASLDPGRVYIDIARVGNTSAASIPLAACSAFANGRLREGDVIALTAFGAGFCWGASLLRWRMPVGADPQRRPQEAVHV